MNLHTAIFVASVLVVSATTLSGENVHCLGGRAHILKYEVTGVENDGSSMDGVDVAAISLDRAALLDQNCDNETVGATPSGDKLLCYGVNQNSDCSGAKAPIAIPGHEGLQCGECYAAVKADVFYKLNYTSFQLNSVQVGLRDIHLLGSATLQEGSSSSFTPFSGSFALPGSDTRVTLIDELVGCPICVRVKIQVAVPLVLDYELDLSSQADMAIGGKIDAHLSDRWAKYDSKTGWSYPTETRSITATPILNLGTVQAKASLTLGFRTGVEVVVDDIASFHLNVNPKIPISASAVGHVYPTKASFCLDGDAEVDISHEADLDWKFSTWHVKEHWGPKQDYRWVKPGSLHLCKNITDDTADNLLV